MTIFELGALGEFVGAIAVVATLAYLAIQIRDQNRESHTRTIQGLIHGWNEILGSYIDIPDVADILKRGSTSYSKLDPKDQPRFAAILGRMTRFFEGLYLQKIEGRINDDLWNGIDNSILDIYSQPGIQEWWKIRGGGQHAYLTGREWDKHFFTATYRVNSMKILRIPTATITALLSMVWVLSAQASTVYDIVLMNGRVMDPETQLDVVRNVGIRNGVIEIITADAISGSTTIDARGLVVAPGFIDTHFHGQDPFAVKMALRDGVTTALDLEAGAFNIDQWYAHKKDNWQINYGMTVSHSMVRLRVHDPEVEADGPIEVPLDFTVAPLYLKRAAADGVPGWSVTRSDTAQINEISAQIDEGLRQGALGVGSGLAYTAKGVSSYEMFEVQRAAARYGRVTAVHTRFHLEADTPTEAPIAFDEVFSNAALLGAPLLIAHNNDYGWEEIEEKLQLARAQGLNMWSEHYPYAAVSTIISARFLQPSIWQDKYGYRYEDTMYAPQSDQFLSTATYEEIVQSDPGQAVIAFIPARKNWLPHWLAVPHMTVASDGMAGSGADGKLLPWEADYSQFAGHPRTAGSFAKTLRLARERGIPLMHSLAQTSYWSAKHLGDAGLQSMQQRGRLQEGMIADISIFDPEKVTDNADYKAGSNGLPSTGIPWVIVNGRVVVDNSRVQKNPKPGQPIRYPVEETGRHVPLSPTKWVGDFTIKKPAADEKVTGLSHLR